MIKLSDIYPNPNNPRLIKDDKFKKLVNSIRDFPQMMELRPIVIDENNIIQGGNMRYKALLELGFIEISETWVKQGKDLTPEQWSEFVIKDNVSFGVMDWDIIANEWDAEKVSEWGLDLPGFDDYSEKNKEIDTDDFGNEMIIKLTYSEDDYNKVKDQLSKIASTPEQAVWKLLNNE